MMEKVQLLTLFYHYLNIKRDLLRFLAKKWNLILMI